MFDTKIVYLSRIGGRTFVIYWSIILLFLISAASLPIIKTTISVKSQGIIRPKTEKAEVRSIITAVIDKVNFKDGDTVQNGEVIIQLHKENLAIKKQLNDFEIKQRSQYIEDLIFLTQTPNITQGAINKLQSLVYQQQANRFLYQLLEAYTELKKVKKEFYMDSTLFSKGVIPSKEWFDKKIEYEKLEGSIKTIKWQQLSTWQGKLAEYKTEKSQYENSNIQLNEDSVFYSIKAPITGVLQEFNKYYRGSLVQAGEILAVISPQAELISECYINTRDVGLLKPNQTVLFQVDAFDYNYFGVLTGKIISINNDYTLFDNKPVFLVKCSIDSKQLHLKNGFIGSLKKGMIVQARFLVAERSLWQLLFDKLDDWLNPNAPIN
jgi:membrane fusion protein, peptide pheromone/bacteriocin exporter